jgi:hypothetical protein
MTQIEIFISWTIVAATLSPPVYQILDNKMYEEGKSSKM